MRKPYVTISKQNLCSKHDQGSHQHTEGLPITNNDEEAMEVLKGLVEMGYSEYAEKFRTNYLALKDAEANV